jgi:ABC-2 type transport system permease protein
MRPFANPQPAVLMLPVVVGATLLSAAYRLSTSRDIGTGMLPTRDVADPDNRLLSSSWAQALRSQLGVLLTWFAAVLVFTFILGVVSHGISSGDVPKNLEDQLAKLGSGSITTPTGYLALIFLFVVLAVCVFACTLIGAARNEEARQQLETLLAQPISRYTWLGGRLVLAAAAIVVVSLLAGVGAWAGARAARVHIALPSMLEAGVNAVPSAVLFLGLAALAYAVAPRASTGIAYGLVVVAFLWQLVGSLLTPPRWILDITPFAQIGLVPTQPFRATAAGVLLALGVIAGIGALLVFRRRDLTGA